MRSNTARKIEVETHTSYRAEIFDFNDLSQMQIAVEAEMASKLSNNKPSCDFEEFLSQYGIKSDFA